MIFFHCDPSLLPSLPPLLLPVPHRRLCLVVFVCHQPSFLHFISNFHRAGCKIQGGYHGRRSRARRMDYARGDLVRVSFRHARNAARFLLVSMHTQGVSAFTRKRHAIVFFFFLIFSQHAHFRRVIVQLCSRRRPKTKKTSIFCQHAYLRRVSVHLCVRRRSKKNVFLHAHLLKACWRSGVLAARCELNVVLVFGMHT